ncbi:MAG: hypothetical protein ACFCUG_02895 [Thiotrichales bacterium]
MSDLIMAILALATLAAFLGVVAWWVPHLDLIIVITIVLLLAAFDFWRSFREMRTRRDTKR